MNTNVLAAEDRRKTVALFEGDGEERQVWIRHGEDGSLEVGEVTHGPLTRQVFGESWHDHRVQLNATVLPLVPRALACAGQDPTSAVSNLLSSEETFLSDLMDILDAQGVPYTYLTISRHGTAFRPAGRCA